jgi:enoyl-CoA hydratase
MTDIHIRRAGRAGRITLNRPKALNALTWEMCLAIEAALDSLARRPRHRADRDRRGGRQGVLRGR